jgi:hypothetical protein
MGQFELEWTPDDTQFGGPAGIAGNPVIDRVARPSEN